MTLLDIRQITENQPGQVGGKAAGLARLVAADAPVPPGFVVLADDRDAPAWVAAAKGLGPLLAVRSSAPDEDGAHTSRAGAYLSVLSVEPDDVPAAVQRVRDSAPDVPMAVIIQRLVPASVSGVLFTVHPVTGSWREMLVEAVAGRGDVLVSGTVRSSAWVLRRPPRLSKALQSAWARIRLSVVERHVVGAAVIIDDAKLRRLGLLGLRLESKLGVPLDIEWCFDEDGALWVVQARPVTASGPSSRGRDVLWTRRFLGERFPKPVSPMGWSLVEPVLSAFVAFPGVQQQKLGGGPAFRLYAGRPYVNASVFRHLAFKWPGAPVPRFLLELLPEDEVAWWNATYSVGADIRVVSALLGAVWRERRWKRFAWVPTRHHADWERTEAALTRLIAEAGPVPPKEALARIEGWQAAIGTYLGVHLCSLLYGHLVLDMLDGVVRAWAPDDAARWMVSLPTAPAGNRTVEVVHDLSGLASHGPFDAASAATREFLARHGHRADLSWDVMTPRWRDAPDSLKPLVEAQRHGHEPKARLIANERLRNEVLSELSGLGWARARVVAALAEQVRRFVLLRENQRYTFDRLLAALRSDLMTVGQGLVDDGVVARAEDIGWLRWPELRDLARAGDVGAVIQERRAAWAADHDSVAPVFLRGDTPVVVPSGPRLVGTAVSAGVASGPVRVVRSLAEGGALRPGEVLVAPAFDPSWAPLLVPAVAAVWELGSVLSHGAVIARELGRPVVANVDGVTSRLTDGMVVTVDGGRGLVWLGEPHEGASRR